MYEREHHPRADRRDCRAAGRRGQARPVAPAAPQTMLTVREAAEYLRCSESLIYAQMKDGRLRGVKVGRRRLIPMRELVRITEGGAAA